MKLKMYEVLALQNFYTSVHDKKLPIQVAYKLSRLGRRAGEEIQFYQKEFEKIVDEYALKKDGQLVFSEDMASIKIIPGKEEECSQKIAELKALEIDMDGFEFSIKDFESLELTLAEMDAILPLIRE